MIDYEAGFRAAHMLLENNHNPLSYAEGREDKNPLGVIKEKYKDIGEMKSDSDSREMFSLTPYVKAWNKFVNNLDEGAREILQDCVIQEEAIVAEAKASSFGNILQTLGADSTVLQSQENPEDPGDSEDAPELEDDNEEQQLSSPAPTEIMETLEEEEDEEDDEEESVESVSSAP